jgi:UDP-glucose 4-epimerase
MADVIDLVGELAGTPVTVERTPSQAGDVLRTGGAIDRAVKVLGWQPEVSLRDGLAAEIEWCRSVLESRAVKVA